MAAIDQIRVSGVAVDEHAARRTLREQIARLERELSVVAIAAYPRLDTRVARRTRQSSARATTSFWISLVPS